MSVVTEVHHGLADLSAIQESNPEHFPYLLESAVWGDEALNQYSILFAFPQERIECIDIFEAENFFSQLHNKWKCAGESLDHTLNPDLPFTGGWFVYLGYEMVQGIEPVLKLPDYRQNFPLAYAARCPAAIIFDHKKQQTICLAERSRKELLSKLVKKLNNTYRTDDKRIHISTIHEESDGIYISGVNKILKYIAAGDVFQVNLSREWSISAEENVEPVMAYRALRLANPAPFACFLCHPMGHIVSSSPERLVRVKNNIVETRPIAGTRPRSHTEKDKFWRQQLSNDNKERAEHIMLIDLERNDIGRVCKAGTVEVDQFMILESYAHVYHIVSNISGILKTDISPVDVLRAVFPGGTITGCPKVRCMEIISELEQKGRGSYTGSAGYINHNGNMDFNILIRTLFINGNQIQFRAGAGIVADSNPEYELKETRHKAKGILLAMNQG